MSDFEDEIDRLAEPDESALVLLQRKLEEATQLKELFDDQEAAAAATKTALHTVRTKELPDLMLSLGMTDLTVNGWNCKLDDLIEGGWPKDEQAQLVATRHLEELHGQDILRTMVTLDFPKANHDMALKAQADLVRLGYDAKVTTGVHYQTYQAFVRGLLKEKLAFEESKLGVMVGKIVKFKRTAK